MVDEDSQLLEAYSRDADAVAFRRLLERHIHFVYAAALRQVHDRHTADDVVQAVFFLLSQKAAKIKPGTFVKGWLFHATRYAASNARRAEMRRKQREREAAAMHSEITSPENVEDIRPHLDSALAGLGTKDRTALLMRYFEEMPLLAVGQAMGISEHAAKKRVARALERLKNSLQSRGVGVTGDALAGAFAFSITQTAPPSAINATIDFIARGTHSGSANLLAKGVSRQMTQNKLKVVVIKCVLAAACVGAGAAVVVQQAHSEPPAKNVPIILADALPASRTADTGAAAQYQACRSVLQSMIDAFDKGDAAAVKSQIYFGPDANPQMVKIVPTLIDVDIAVYRLQKAALARFGIHAMGLDTDWRPTVVRLVELMPRIDAKDCRVLGDTVVITPAAPIVSYSSTWAWPRKPLYFQNVDGIWKLDYGRTFKIEYRVRRNHPIPGETREQALIEGEKTFINGFNTISDDLDNGKINDAGELQQRIFGVMLDLWKEFPDISADTEPR